MVLLAAFDVLLYRYTGQRDVVVGTPIAGRTRAETESLIGLFVNTLALRAELEGEQSFRELLARVREACLGAYAHQDLPFERLVEELSPARDLSRTPLFQAMLVLQNAPQEDEVLAGLRQRGVAADSGTAKFDLMLTLSETPRGLAGNLEYAADLFDAATIERMVGHLRALLEGIVAEPSRPLGRLPMLSAEETQRVLVAWNHTEILYPAGARLQELVEEQVARTPGAVAVTFEDRALTYRALDAQANRLAHRLQRFGVGPNVLVGVCLERSLELPVALLAVLKAGGAYVPIDPGYPRERIEHVLADARAPVLVTQAHLVAQLPHGGTEVVALDAGDLSDESVERPDCAAGPGDLAYVIYTSGSTGQPKGVMIPHRAIVNHMRWMHAVFPLGPGHAVLQKTPISFDASIWELYLPLMGGARLVVARPGGHRDPAYLVQAVVEHRITELQLVPALVELVVAEPGLARCTSLERLFVGGEVLRRSLVDRLRARLPIDVVNLYGPTECAVQTVVWTAEPVSSASMEPIGRPIHNVRTYVLDRGLEPVPVGVTGELYLGGAAVGLGYVGRPELTAAQFIPDPFASAPGGRLYATGDLCRYRPDGVLEYLGRRDGQVKLRGFRVETGEVEAVLRQHPVVRDAVVLAREDTPGDQRLVAYVVPVDADQPPGVAALRAFVKERLPEYMVPSALVVMDALPLTPNGKVDRKALPAPELPAAREHVAPRGPVEEAVSAIFAEVLKLDSDRTGAHDGFFELGGHSLLATQAVARIRATFGVELPLRALFEAPSPAELAERIEAALRRRSGIEVPPVVRAPRVGEMAMSFAQERLWFLQQLDPDDTSYLVPAAIRLEGTLDGDALARTFEEVVRRHEVLRTRCSMVDGSLVAIVDERFHLELPVVDLTSRPEAEREVALREAIAAEMRRPFDLGAAPPIRAKLFSLGEAVHVLLVVIHHIATDAWSTGALSREVSALYEAFAAGRPSPLAELSVQYADYAAWQRRWLTGEILERQLAYWRGELAGAPEALTLPTDRPRPAVRTSRGRHALVNVSQELTLGLRELAKRQGATLYMVLLAALDVLLYRMSGQLDVVVGSPIAGRTRAETEGMVGLFLNMLALRARVEDAEPFTTLLARVKETCLGAYAHQDLPFERLVQELAVERDPSRTPLFQVVLNLQNAPATGAHLAGLRLHNVDVDTGTTKFDLTFILSEGPRGIAGTLSYRTDLFEAATVERMVGYLSTLLESIVAEPSRPVGELPLMRAEERYRLIASFHAAKVGVGVDVDACVHALFEAQAERTPEALAVVAGADRLTFAELDLRANQLAHQLRRLGVGPDAVVGLCMDRTAQLIVGLLGIMKAGGAYLPLDPTLPRQRLRELLDEAGVSGVVTADRVAAALPEHRSWRVRLDAEAAVVATESDARPEPAARPEHLAYVLFTSGSTGRPKGVAVEHRNLVAYLRGASERLAVPSGASYAHVSTFAADLGNTSLFLPLCLGGTLHLISEEWTKDPAELGAYFQEHGIDCLKITPSHLAALLSAPQPERLVPRRALVLGGEALSWELVERLQRLSPGCRVFNHYGPTETTVGVLAGAVSELRRDAATAPLGRPLRGACVYVLDAQREHVPVGMPGEVYLGGAQVARGYLGQPERTAERFVPDPFGAAGARLYRTGDRARRLLDGTVLFLGRVDHQVKVRGYRVELGEIEAVLEQHPSVRDAVVLALDDSAAGKRLAGFVVTEPRAAIAELMSYLGDRLPSYLVPGALTVLDALPLTSNGKVDRRALEALAQREDRDLVAPRTPTEEVLEAIWADVFGREHVGVHERFDELGGHSLLAIQLIARVRDAFQLEVPLRAIFDAPTITELAGRIEALQREGGVAAAPPIERAPRDEPLPLSFGQERLWFLDQLEPGSPLYNVASGRHLLGALDAAVMERALREVVRRHEVLRTTFALTKGQPVQVIHDEVLLRLPVDDLGGLSGPEREARVAEITSAETRRPFDLERGPVLRVRLLRLGPEDHVLLAVLHHIVSDASTQGVLYDELERLYAAFRAGLPSPLPELPVQYADYAAWQRQWLSGELLERQLDWWKAHLAGAPAALELPTDRPRPPVMSHRGGRRSIVLSAELRRALHALARREGVTLFMVLLASFDVLLSRWSGQRDVVVGTPITGRTRPELEGLIGFFVNTLALRVEVDDEQSFTELLHRLREICLGAYAHQDLPFERLVEELNPARQLSRLPVFQVAMMLENAPREARADSGLQHQRLSPDAGTAKFDLLLALGEGPDGLAGGLEYATDLFDGSTIERMLGCFRTLLEGIAADPGCRLAELLLLSVAEREQGLVAWNRTATGYPRNSTVHALFEGQAARTPEALALVFGEESLTYGELNRRANQLARRLRALGVGRDSRVGLCVERSPQMVVGMLGILKAGGAYVPLEPTYPKARLAFMIEDAGTRLVLTPRRLSDVLPDHGGAVLCLDDALDEESDADLASGAEAEDLAYVIYTSGSTGTPKGVAVTHRSVARLVRDTNYLALGPSDRVAQASNTAFDAATFEIWGALLGGARLIGVAKDLVLAPEAFEIELRRSGITVLFVTTALFNGLVRERPAIFSTLRCVLFGGEQVDPTWVRAALRDGPSRLLHVYGPTETTTFATFHHVEAVADDATTVPIGQPLANTTAYVLDPRGEPVPIGVPGELYLGGDALARGYLNRPELTAERFVPDPFSAEPGARLYGTGDRVRRRADGAVVFLGRRDDQIKLRGFRVELGEIEAALLAHPAVREAVVLVREDAPDDKRLCAYLTDSATHRAPPLPELRAFVRERLPEYMMPSAFMVLEALPLTPNGKVDKKALPAPEVSADGEQVAPRDPVEDALCRIFAEVLRVERVSVHDNFFTIGGDSILSIQVVSRARAAGLALTPRQLFEHQTVAELSSVVGVVSAGQAEEGPVTGPVLLTPIQRWWLSDEPVDPHHFNQSVLLEASEPMDAVLLEEAARAVLERHDALRLRLPRGENGWEPHIVPFDGTAPFERVDLSGLPDGERAAALTLVAERTQASLDLAAGPMLRVVLFASGPGGLDRLLIVVHHFAVDGVSWRIILDDLWSAYEARRRGEAARLPARTTSIHRWSRQLSEHARSEAVAAEREYWLSVARRRVPRLPVDQAQGENTGASARSAEVSLSAAETEALLRVVPEAYRTRIDEVLLTALAQAMHGWTGAEAVLIDLEGHGREELFEGVQLTRTVGWFTVMYPMVLEFACGSGLGEALIRVKEQLRAVPQSGIGYGLLRYLRGDEELTEALSALPQAEVSFNYLGQLDQALPEASPLRGARESVGPSRSTRARRRREIDVVALIAGGHLQARFTYAETRYHSRAAEALAARFIESLRALVAHCSDAQIGGPSPSDLRDRGADLTEDVLDFVGSMDPSAAKED